MARKASQKSRSSAKNHLCEAVFKAAEKAAQSLTQEDPAGEALVSYLAEQALKSPSPFLSLLWKVVTDKQEEQSPTIKRIELISPHIEKKQPKDA